MIQMVNAFKKSAEQMRQTISYFTTRSLIPQWRHAKRLLPIKQVEFKSFHTSLARGCWVQRCAVLHGSTLLLTVNSDQPIYWSIANYKAHLFIEHENSPSHIPIR